MIYVGATVSIEGLDHDGPAVVRELLDGGDRVRVEFTNGADIICPSSMLAPATEKRRATATHPRQARLDGTG